MDLGLDHFGSHDVPQAEAAAVELDRCAESIRHHWSPHLHCGQFSTQSEPLLKSTSQLQTPFSDLLVPSLTLPMGPEPAQEPLRRLAERSQYPVSEFPLFITSQEQIPDEFTVLRGTTKDYHSSVTMSQPSWAMTVPAEDCTNLSDFIEASSMNSQRGTSQTGSPGSYSACPVCHTPRAVSRYFNPDDYFSTPSKRSHSTEVSQNEETITPQRQQEQHLIKTQQTDLEQFLRMGHAKSCWCTNGSVSPSKQSATGSQGHQPCAFHVCKFCGKKINIRSQSLEVIALRLDTAPPPESADECKYGAEDIQLTSQTNNLLEEDDWALVPTNSRYSKVKSQGYLLDSDATEEWSTVSSVGHLISVASSPVQAPLPASPKPMASNSQLPLLELSGEQYFDEKLPEHQ